MTDSLGREDAFILWTGRSYSNKVGDLENVKVCLMPAVLSASRGQHGLSGPDGGGKIKLSGAVDT